MLAECWEFGKDDSRLIRGSFLLSVRGYSEDLKFSEKEIAPSVCWPPIPYWLWPEADVDLSINKSIQEGRVGNIALFVEENLRHNWNTHMHTILMAQETQRVGHRGTVVDGRRWGGESYRLR